MLGYDAHERPFPSEIPVRMENDLLTAVPYINLWFIIIYKDSFEKPTDWNRIFRQLDHCRRSSVHRTTKCTQHWHHFTLYEWNGSLKLGMWDTIVQVVFQKESRAKIVSGIIVMHNESVSASVFDVSYRNDQPLVQIFNKTTFCLVSPVTCCGFSVVVTLPT